VKIFTFLLLLASCSGIEERKEFFENGKIKSIAQVKNGLKNGEMVEYRSDGSIYTRNHYKNDTLNGPYEIYFHSGVIAERGNFVNGIRLRKIEQFYENGELHFEHYMLNIKGNHHPYYTLEFDSLGTLINDNRRVNVTINGSTFNEEAVIKVIDSVRYDSMRVYWGIFDWDFTPQKIDSALIKGNQIEVKLPSSNESEFLRGYIVKHRTKTFMDSTQHFRTYSFFECPLEN
jgi:hypothetical protein